jgi:gamma-glutamyl hercynylcysteine S-oxide synthase
MNRLLYAIVIYGFVPVADVNNIRVFHLYCAALISEGESMGEGFDRDEIARLMNESREETLRLFDIVISEADLRRPPAEGYRPILWHMGHVGAFEHYWISQRVKGDPTLSPRYDRVFDPIKTPREDANHLPPIPEIKDYLWRVRAASIDFLSTVSPDSRDPMLADGYVFNIVIEHEYQHQETLAYLLQLLPPELKEFGVRSSEFGVGSLLSVEDNGKDESLTPNSELRTPNLSSSEMVYVEGGPFEMGSSGYPFAYDNEQPPHMVELRDFRIDRFPVTNAQFAEFIAAGGYSTRSLWSDEGWAWKEENGVKHPLYWSRVGETGSKDLKNARWRVREMFAETELKADHPVTGVSWHEAESYARFAGKRLATEAEWEKAASWDAGAGRKRRFSWGDEPADKTRANFGNNNWGTSAVAAHPAGRSAYGCFDMTGNAWEWTASLFDSYPGFKAYPYPEYSELWFDGDHRVLKGGSWMTREPLLRCSFRNFWRPRFRIAFAGFRCAAD